MIIICRKAFSSCRLPNTILEVKIYRQTFLGVIQQLHLTIGYTLGLARYHLRPYCQPDIFQEIL